MKKRYPPLIDQKFWKGQAKNGDWKGTQDIIDWIKENSQDFRCDNGYQTYIPIIRRFCNFLQKSKRWLKKIKTAREDYLHSQVKQFFRAEGIKDLMWRTRRTYLCAVQWFLTKFLKCEKSDVFIRREADKYLPMVTKEEFGLMLKCSQRCSFSKGDPNNQCSLKHPKCTFEKERNALILQFLYDTGARASEICKLKVKDYKHKEGTFRRTKNGKDRDFKVSNEVHKGLVNFIKKYPEKSKERDSRHVFYFGKSQNVQSKTRSLQNMIKSVVEKAQIKNNLTPHSFRRSFATNLYNRNVKLIDIRDTMGHAGVSSTEIYIKRSAKDREDIPTGLDAVKQSNKAKKAKDSNVGTKDVLGKQIKELLKSVQELKSEQVESRKETRLLREEIKELKEQNIKLLSENVSLKRKTERPQPEEELVIRKQLKFASKDVI